MKAKHSHAVYRVSACHYWPCEYNGRTEGVLGELGWTVEVCHGLTGGCILEEKIVLGVEIATQVLRPYRRTKYEYGKALATMTAITLTGVMLTAIVFVGLTGIPGHMVARRLLPQR